MLLLPFELEFSSFEYLFFLICNLYDTASENSKIVLILKVCPLILFSQKLCNYLSHPAKSTL